MEVFFGGGVALAGATHMCDLIKSNFECTSAYCVKFSRAELYLTMFPCNVYISEAEHTGDWLRSDESPYPSRFLMRA